MFRIALIAVATALAVSGCTTVRESSPQRTATEQLLISTAADRAAERLALRVPSGARVFVDAANFEGIDSKYAIGAIRDHLLRTGMKLVADRGNADTVVEIRAGALSVDEKQLLVGIPQMNIPIPLAGSFSFPEIALFKTRERKGVAKFAATAYGAAEGSLVDSSGPQYGYSHQTEWVVLLFLSWTSSDLIPEERGDPPADEAAAPPLHLSPPPK
jgi:hypothetical protein